MITCEPSVKQFAETSARCLGEFVLFVHQFAIAHSLGFFQSEALGFVGFVVGVGTFEEEDVAIAFEGEDVGADAVEEPAVVRDDHGTDGFKRKPEDSKLSRAERKIGQLEQEIELIMCPTAKRCKKNGAMQPRHPSA